MKRNHLTIRRVILVLLVCLMPINIKAQKVNHLDTLNTEQLNLYKDKAVNMRNAGIIVTFGGIGISVAGFYLASTMLNPTAVALSSLMVGIAAPAVGIPLWTYGGIRKAQAEFLDIDMYKAVRMRNAGIILTSVGVGAMVTGTAIGLYAASNEDPGAAAVALICGAGGVSFLAVGIPLWSKGAKGKAEVELTLQTFNIAPENSMLLGLGITIKF